MDITLRKANTIQNTIRDAINDISIKTSLEINEFEDIDKVIADASANLYIADKRRHNLTTALYDIRSLVGIANATSGLNEKLAKAAMYDRRIIQLSDFSKLAAMLDRDVIVGRLEKIKKQPIESSRYSLSRSDTVVSTTVLTQEQINQAAASIKELQKNKRKLNDEILSLNVSVTVKLSDETVKVLTDEGLL